MRSLVVAHSSARSLARSLAASGFEISVAVVDVRCPRSDRGPGTEREREPRQSRLEIDRSPSIGGIAEVSPTSFAGKTPSTRRAHVPRTKPRTGTRFRYPPIDQSIAARSSASPRRSSLSIPREKGRTSIGHRGG